MEGIDSLRNAAAALSAKALGKDAKQPHQFQGQMAATDFITIVMTLPTDTSGWNALQDPLTGELLYITDGDVLDGMAIG